MNIRNRVSDSKKGNVVLDNLLLVVILFAMSIIGFIAFPILSEVNTFVQADPNIINESKVILADNTEKAPSTFDGIYVTVFILVWGLLLIGSYNIKTSPALFVFFIIIFAIIAFVGMVLANAADAVASESTLASYAAQMPWTLFIIEHFLIIIIFVLGSCALVLWGKNLFGSDPF